MKKITTIHVQIILCLFLLSEIISFSSYGQTRDRSFESFLSKFVDFRLPFNGPELLADRERVGDYENLKILRNEYEKYLEGKDDTIWKFKNEFDLRNIGKIKQHNFWVVLYFRGFLLDDVDLARGEFVLTSLTLDGNIISLLPIAGGYGDSLTFESVISDFEDIKINFKSYQNGVETNFTKSYFLDNGGVFKIKPGNK